MQISRNGIPNEPPAQSVTPAPAQSLAAAGMAYTGVAPGPAKAPALGHGVDTTTLSSAASSAAQLIAQALTGDAEQPAKVSRILEAVGNGSYKVDSGQLASALMVTMLARGARGGA